MRKFEGIYSRSAVVIREGNKGINEEERSIGNIVATEDPTVVFDWARWEPIREILLMSGVELPESKQIPLLRNHSRWSDEDVVGSTRNLTVEGDILTGRNFISEVEANLWTKIREGHVTDTSVGYRTYSEHSIRLAPGEETNIDGKVYRNDYADGMDLIIRKKWKPMEDSVTPIGADQRSKMRSELNPSEDVLKKIELIEAGLAEQNKRLSDVTITIKERSEMKPTEKNAEDAVREERERVSEIEEWGKRFGNSIPKVDELISEARSSGISVLEFKERCWERMDKSKPVETPATDLDLTGKEMDDYSPLRMIQSIISGKREEAGIEREYDTAVREVLKVAPRKDSFFIHPKVFNRFAARILNQRTMKTSGSTTGAALVGVEHMEDGFIEYLRAASVLGEAGITILSGLKSDISLPVQTSEGGFAWGEEGDAGSASDMNFTNKTASPKFGRGQRKYTKTMMLQSAPSIELLVMKDLLGKARNGVETALLHGTGADNQPQGLANTSGVGSVNISSLTWNKIVEFETDIETADADISTMQWVTTPGIKGALKTTPIVDGYPMFIMNNGEVNGYPLKSTNNVSAHHLFFGAWEQLILCDWGMYEIMVNDKLAGSDAGNVEITIFVHVDAVTKYPLSFSIGSNAVA